MKSLASLPEELHEQVVRAMLAGEEPLWIAQPIPSLVNRLTVPSIFFAVFAVFFSALFVAFAGWAGMPFLLIFIAIPTATPFLVRRRMRRTVYVLTARRALLLRPEGRKGWQTVAWPLAPGMVKERVLRADGSGDLIFGYEGGSDKDSNPVPMGFFNLPELRRLEQLLMDITEPRPAMKG